MSCYCAWRCGRRVRQRHGIGCSWISSVRHQTKRDLETNGSKTPSMASSAWPDIVSGLRLTGCFVCVLRRCYPMSQPIPYLRLTLRPHRPELLLNLKESVRTKPDMIDFANDLCYCFLKRMNEGGNHDARSIRPA